MKKILFIALLGLGIISLTSCEDNTNKTEVKKETPTKKCAANGKCGEGKCGNSSKTK